MARTEAQRKIQAKRARRPIYMVVRRLVDPATGESVGALVPAHPIDQRLMKERKFHVNREVRAELKQPRNAKFHRLAHAVGNLLVENVEEFRDMSGHDAFKDVQRRSGVCCDKIEIDLGALGKVPVNQARSIAFDEMEEDEFSLLFQGVTSYIGEHYTSVMVDDVVAEFWLMVNGENA
jgi:hypothetical protein